MRIAAIAATAAGLIVLLPSGGPPSAGAETKAGESFVDRFDRLDNARWFIADGWSNGDYQSCIWRRGNVKVGDNHVELTLRLEPELPAMADGKGGGAKSSNEALKRQARPYSCAEMQSRALYGYGTYEARIRPAALSGTVSAFFTYMGPGLEKGKPHDEIDFEVLGKNTRQVQLNFFHDGKGGNEAHVGFAYDAAGRAATLAFDWRPGALRWYIDGKLVREVVAVPGKPLPSEPSKIYLSFWSGTGPSMAGWLGPFEPAKLPARMVVEFVAFTRMGEDCRFPDSIVCGFGK